MKMIIMVGIPGSGKSYTARQLVDNGVILSTDDIFNGYTYPSGSGSGVEGGVPLYLWDRSVLGSAHHINQIKCGQALSRGISPVIIDNTNLTKKEREPYEKLAGLFGYSVEIKESDAPWKDDPNECFNRCTHDVPLKTIEEMLNRKCV